MNSQPLIIIPILTVVTMFAVIPLSYGITATQEDLTEAEQETLDKIAKAKADGTYILPPEAPLTANVQVYSDEVTIRVTHPVDIEAIHCWTDFDLYVPTTQCILPGFPPHPEDQYFDTDTETWRPVEELKQAFQEEQEAIKQQTMTKEEIYNQERIDYIKNRTLPSDNELEELKLREQIGALCRNDTLVSQTYREFDVETEIFLDQDGNWQEQLKVDRSLSTDSFRKSKFVQDLKNQVQECIAQPFTKKSIQYDHIVVDGLFSADPNKPVAPDAITAHMVNDEENKGIVHNKTGQCSTHFPEATRQLFNCPTESPDPSTKDTPELTNYMSSTAWQKYLQYVENPESMLDEAIRKNENNRRAEVVYGGQK